MADVRLKTVATFQGHTYIVPMGTHENKIKEMVFNHFQDLFPALDMKKETVQMTAYYAPSCKSGYCFYGDN